MRNLFTAATLALLAACATVPAKPGFNKQQVAVLTENGFKPEGENYELGLADRVLFDVDKADLKPEMTDTLTKLTKALAGVGIHGATVEGHTDSTGADDYNQALSERRAQAVKALIVTSGMAEPEVAALGKGETDPIADNATEDGRAQNRRVVIVVTPVNAMALKD
ncbi:OmpA family protein [Novosphingobium sp. B 225]|uniref:OmpA family protein n=1 Tax=Novosphingobium sp. B 225 TaxID=1961849 RepID=UPI0020CEFE55|nr:OmpA family protein [Novosphingobium sp. B 225]